MKQLLLALLLVALPHAARADSLSTSGTPSPNDLLDLDSNFVTGVSGVTDFRWLPDDRMVILTKSGTAYVRPAGGGSLISAGTFPVDTDSEKGLLGVAVDPNFTVNRKLYFYYSLAAGSGGTNANRHRVVWRTLAANSMLDPGETVILSGLRGPANHDGGALDIGPDGLLYVGVGDTGNNSNAAPGGTITNYYGACLSDDPTNRGGANGKILRIALDGSIPPTNPLVGATNVTQCGTGPADAPDPGRLGDPRTEVFAWGFRNPFRLWVDPLTDRVWVGDVGEITYEEVTIVQPGRNHGWPYREGGQGYPATQCHDVRIGTGPGNTPIQDGDCVDPVYYCRHGGASQGIDGGCASVTGGLILDDCHWPATIRGQYVFGDNATDTLWMLTPTPARDGITGPRLDFGTISGTPVALRQGNDGALYVAAYGSNRIARISPKAPAACVTTTTSTTLPGESTTTSTSSTTTSTTLPGPCGNVTDFALATCQVGPLRTDPLCGSDTVPPGIVKTVHARAERAVMLLGKAEAATITRKQLRLLAQTERTLKAIATRVSRAGRKVQISANCQSTLGDAVAGARQTVATLRGR